jgi:hypothetical protein
VIGHKYLQLDLGVGLLFQKQYNLLNQFAYLLLEYREKDIKFIIKIEINRAVGHLRFLGNVGNAGIEEAFFGKDFSGSTYYFAVLIW